MLASLRLQSFKCFKETGNIDIKPITIFIGTNNSGKNNILQPLLMLKQTLESGDIESPLVVRTRT